MVSIRQWEHSRWRLLKFALIAVWAANNLIQGPFKHTVAVHLFMITNFIYHAVPRAKRCPGAESRAVVRMFTVVDDAPKVVFLSKENLFVCVFDREQISRRATAACKCQRWCLIRRKYLGVWSISVANWPTNYFVRLFLFTLDVNSRTHQQRKKPPKNSQEQIASWQIMRKKKRGSFWLTANKLVFWKIVLAQSRQTDTDIKHRGGECMYECVRREWQSYLQANGNVYHRLLAAHLWWQIGGQNDFCAAWVSGVVYIKRSPEHYRWNNSAI